MPTAALVRSWKAFYPQLLQSSLASCKGALHRIFITPVVRIAGCGSAAPALAEKEQQQRLQNRARRFFVGIPLYHRISSPAAPDWKRSAFWRGAGCGGWFYSCLYPLPSNINFFEISGYSSSSRPSHSFLMDSGIGERTRLEMSEKKEGNAAEGQKEAEGEEEGAELKVGQLQQQGQKEEKEQVERVKKEEEEAERKRKAEKEREIEEKIGPPPEKPLAGDCCEQGCVVCVWDTYWEELDEYEKLRKAAEEELAGK